MQCQKCGASLPDHYKFCIRCGNKIAVNEAQPQPPYNPAAGQQQATGKHFSLEDIARQQEEKKDIGFSSTPSSLPEEQNYENEGNEDNPTSGDPEGQAVLDREASYQTQASSQGRRSADNILLYSIGSPAVPLGKQKQTCISLFDKDAAQKLAALKNN